jgi:hypothetical protein
LRHIKAVEFRYEMTLPSTQKDGKMGGVGSADAKAKHQTVEMERHAIALHHVGEIPEQPKAVISIAGGGVCVRTILDRIS